MDYKAIGSRIRRRRLYMKYSQEQLAEKLGISVSFLGHIERGTRKMSLDSLYRIARTLECSSDFLLGMMVPTDALIDIADDVVDKALSIAMEELIKRRMPEEIVS